MNPDAIAQLWDVGAVQSVTALAGGSINGAYRVQADAGAFHLRVYRDSRKAVVEREHAAVHCALRVGVPTPAVQPARGGGAVARLGNTDAWAWAALFNLAPGAPIPRAALTECAVWALGDFLGRLHARLPAQAGFEVPRVGESSHTDTIQRLQRIEQAIQARPELDERDTWALERTRQRLAHLHSTDPTPYQPRFPFRFLHGDYHDGNVFFQGSQPAAIIDWEACRLGPRAWEIVRFLDYSLRLDPTLCEAFLAAYREMASLSSAELQDGAQFYASLQERNVWTYESVYLDGNPGPRQFIHPPPYVPFQKQWWRSGLT